MEENNKKKPSYAELEEAMKKVMAERDLAAQQAIMMRRQLESAGIIHQEVGLMLKVIEFSDKFPTEFVEQCKNKIIEIMSPAPEDNKENKE